MTKRTKKYRPRVVINPLQILSERSGETIESGEQLDLGLTMLTSLDGMTHKETANERLWSSLVAMLNTSLLLCQAGRNPEKQPTVDGALNGMVVVRNRAVNGHGWHLGNHYAAVRAGVDVCLTHMKELPKESIRKALHEVIRRVGAQVG